MSSFIYTVVSPRHSFTAFRLSKMHKDHPWGMDVHGHRHEVPYWPGDSLSGMFGGNSNWRGPICERIRWDVTNSPPEQTFR